MPKKKTKTKGWKIKYYKGLGTSTAKEFKEYFKDRYGSVTTSMATSNGHTASSEAVKLDELF